MTLPQLSRPAGEVLRSRYVGRRASVASVASVAREAGTRSVTLAVAGALRVAEPAPARAEAVADGAADGAADGGIRILSVCVAVLGLLLLAPLLLLVALAIKLDSRGPVLYTQVRVGIDRRRRRGRPGHDRRRQDLGGQPFTMYKFRTMRANAESDGQAVWASRRDPRVTAVGHFLRRTRLDEVPQFYNVLRGEMNVVGPRPERPAIFAQLRPDIPGYALRQRVLPGITGWAQINQAYDETLDDVRRKTALDLEYLHHRSVAWNVAIMLQTVAVMASRRLGW